jgi:hypothetical protein
MNRRRQDAERTIAPVEPRFLVRSSWQDCAAEAGINTYSLLEEVFGRGNGLVTEGFMDNRWSMFLR